MIERSLKSIISQRLFTGKAIILIGARQVGKTTLLHEIVSGIPDTLWLDGDVPEVKALFEEGSPDRFRAQFAGKKLIVLDEAQRISNIGIRLKHLTDHFKELQVIATGSSSFELANEINEPLTGRKWEYNLFPFSYGEMINHHGLIREKSLLTHRLVYGYYPEVVNSEGNEKETLRSLSDSYLFKDILNWEQLKKPDKLTRLLQALAFQIGNQVSDNELGQLIGMDHKTVARYLNLLEKVFIIFRLPSFARNLRNELKISRKIYFFDNGIRNALISNFQIPEMRQDAGALWENFLISERMKYNHYNQKWCNSYFWRTHEQQEIDYIEDYDGKLHGYEFKWNPQSKARFPKTFLDAYPGSETEVITRANMDGFLMKK
jgi:predicted AAA+ superfamily ATPase